MSSAPTKNHRDVLDEARELLREPSRNTQRKILISVNLIIGVLFALHVAVQLATAGRMPAPARDNIMFPVSIVIHLGSAGYNILQLSRQVEGSSLWNAITKWSTVLVLQAVCLAVVHMTPNTATSILLDQSFSIVTIFLTGVILGRRAAVAWFIITLVSLIFAVEGRGASFEYHLMTQAEVAKLRVLQEQDPAAFGQRFQAVLEERLLPLPVMLFAFISGLFGVIAFLATYFETGMIGQVLGAIPAALDKIQIAAGEKQKLAQENVRMGLELDVAQRLQAMILPRDEELARCQGIEVVARMQAATEVGGDIYEVLPRPDGSTFLAIGDVTDHGLASGVVMLMSQTALRTCLEDGQFDLVQSLVHVNSVIYKNVQTRMGDARNLSLSLLHHRDGHVRLAGQHEKVMVLRKESNKVEVIDTMDLGCTVGLIDDISPMLAETGFDLGPGDVMLLFTDGVTEAEDTKREMYGEERLEGRWRSCPICPARRWSTSCSAACSNG